MTFLTHVPTTSNAQTTRNFFMHMLIPNDYTNFTNSRHAIHEHYRRYSRILYS